jgi:hypothetical protein
MFVNELAHALKAYQADHAIEGFPSNLPMVPSSKDAAALTGLYKIYFTTSRSKTGNPGRRILHSSHASVAGV